MTTVSPRTIVVCVEGCTVADVQGIPPGYEVEVRNYDVPARPSEPEAWEIQKDDDGRAYFEGGVWNTEGEL